MINWCCRLGLPLLSQVELENLDWESDISRNFIAQVLTKASLCTYLYDVISQKDSLSFFTAQVLTKASLCTYLYDVISQKASLSFFIAQVLTKASLCTYLYDVISQKASLSFFYCTSINQSQVVYLPVRCDITES